MRIVFFGTDEFAKGILAFLLKQNLQIVAVVTRADKPKGRSLKMEAPAVKELCLELGFQGKVFQPVKASAPEFVSELQQLQPDLFVVVSYGQILKQNVLDVPSYGTINVHPSLLPKYRGPSPIQSVVLAGESETAVTIMEMELAMDAGGLIKAVLVPVSKEMSYGELEITSTPQDEKCATYTKKIQSEDSFLNWNRSAKEIVDFVRGMNPRPGARLWVQSDGKKLLLKVFKVKEVPFQAERGGVVLHFDAEHGLIISSKDAAVALLEVQLEGKKRVPIKDFINGFCGKVEFLT